MIVNLNVVFRVILYGLKYGLVNNKKWSLLSGGKLFEVIECIIYCGIIY